MAKPKNRSLYSPLGPSQIRLLTLLPGDSQDRNIQCTLKQASLHIESAREIQYWRVQETLSRSRTQRRLRQWKLIGQPRYEALSYCWGPDVIYDSIEINSHQVPVRRGLWAALHHLRYPSGGKKRVLWTDALCINQNDLSERAHQVAIMYAIFNRASEVIVWLGEVYEKSNLAMKAIARCKQAEDYSEAEIEDDPRSGLDFIITRAAPRTDVGFLIERDQAILSLYNRPYWSRLWILQEVCLAKRLRVHCGTKSVTWEQFDHFWMHFRRSGGIYPGVSVDYSGLLGTSCAIPEGLERLMDMMHRRTCFSSMLHLLKVSQHLQCWDIKDRVFGLLGLVHQRLGSSSLEADYSKSLQQLYIDVMEWYMINEINNLGKHVLEMSQVLQDALERPFQGGLGTTRTLNWKSGVFDVRYPLRIMSDQIIDYVQCVGPLMHVQQSQNGKFLELHVTDAKPFEGLIPENLSTTSFDPHASEVLNSTTRIVYRQLQEQRTAMQRFLSSGSTCCAFITMKGDVFLGGPDVAIGDAIYAFERGANQNIWSFKIRMNEGRQWHEVTGLVYPWTPLDNSPDGPAFVQQLLAQAIIPALDETPYSALELSIRDIQRLTDDYQAIKI